MPSFAQTHAWWQLLSCSNSDGVLHRHTTSESYTSFLLPVQGSILLPDKLTKHHLTNLKAIEEKWHPDRRTCTPCASHWAFESGRRVCRLHSLQGCIRIHSQGSRDPCTRCCHSPRRWRRERASWRVPRCRWFPATISSPRTICEGTRTTGRLSHRCRGMISSVMPFS